MGRSSRRSKVRWKSPSLSPGKPQMTSVPMPHSGISFGDPPDQGTEVLGAIASLHSGEDGIGSALQRDVEVAGKSGLSRHELDELLRHRCRLDGTQPQALESRSVEDPAEKLRQGEASRRQVQPVVAHVHPADDDLHVPRVDELAYLIEHALCAPAAGSASRLRHDAEGARLVAAFLDLHEGPAVVHHLRDRDVEEGSGLRYRGHRHSRLRRLDRLRLADDLRPVRGAHDQRHARQRRDLFRGSLRIAAGDDDLHARALLVQAPYRLARARIGPSGDAAGIDHIGIRLVAPGHAAPASGLLEERADRLGVVLVQTAAEGMEGHPFHFEPSLHHRESADSIPQSRSRAAPS